MDEAKVVEFIDWLPELESHEVYYVSLFARSKYCKEIVKLKSDKCQLKRFTTKKDWFLDKLYQLEVEYGRYKQDGVIIPQEALCVYVTINPRDLVEATRKTISELTTNILRPYNGFLPDKVAMSNIQKSCTRKLFMNVDFDGVGIDESKDLVHDIINPECCRWVATRGGFHLLIEYSKIHKSFTKSYYNKICSLPGVDVKSEPLLPVPGTYQGGFVPYII